MKYFLSTSRPASVYIFFLEIICDFVEHFERLVLWNWHNVMIHWRCLSARYTEGTTVLRNEVKASEFVWSEKPLEMLGSITSMSFTDPDCKVIKNHDLTTDEVYLTLLFLVSLCKLINLDSVQSYEYCLTKRLELSQSLHPWGWYVLIV